MDCKRLILALALLASVARAESNAARPAKYDSNLFSLGVHATSVYSYPFVEYQRLIINHLAIGAFAFFMENNAGDSANRIKGYAGTLNFYALDGYRGLWIRGGYGRYIFETRFGAEHERFQQSGFLGTIGARGKWEGGINIGLSVGALFIKPFASTLVDFTISGTVPLVTFDLGVNF